MSRPIELSVQEFAALRAAGAPVAVLDVREPWEVALVSIADAIHIPLGQVPGHFEGLPADRPVVVYCHHGMRSRQATEFLRSRGLEQAVNLAGGIDAYAREVDPSLAVY